MLLTMFYNSIIWQDQKPELVKNLVILKEALYQHQRGPRQLDFIYGDDT